MFRVFEVVLFGIGDTFGERVGGKVGSFGEDEKPHWIVCCLRQFLETMSETRFVLFPIASHED